MRLSVLRRPLAAPVRRTRPRSECPLGAGAAVSARLSSVSGAVTTGPPPFLSIGRTGRVPVVC